MRSATFSRLRAATIAGLVSMSLATLWLMLAREAFVPVVFVFTAVPLVLAGLVLLVNSWSLGLVGLTAALAFTVVWLPAASHLGPCLSYGPGISLCLGILLEAASSALAVVAGIGAMVWHYWWRSAEG